MKKEKIVQHKLYEFAPSEDISQELVQELARVVRVGITGRVLDLLSEDLKKQFKEIKNG
jgi:hypothetical protein